MKRVKKKVERVEKRKIERDDEERKVENKLGLSCAKLLSS